VRTEYPATRSPYALRVVDDGNAIHYSAVSRGTPVYAADGTEVGTVEQVVDNYREHILDGIVLRTTAGDLRFVDAPAAAGSRASSGAPGSEIRLDRGGVLDRRWRPKQELSSRSRPEPKASPWSVTRWPGWRRRWR